MNHDSPDARICDQQVGSAAQQKGRYPVRARSSHRDEQLCLVLGYDKHIRRSTDLVGRMGTHGLVPKHGETQVGQFLS